jgi:hypothetical protein
VPRHSPSEDGNAGEAAAATPEGPPRVSVARPRLEPESAAPWMTRRSLPPSARPVIRAGTQSQVLILGVTFISPVTLPEAMLWANASWVTAALASAATDAGPLSCRDAVASSTLVHTRRRPRPTPVGKRKSPLFGGAGLYPAQ